MSVKVLYQVNWENMEKISLMTKNDKIVIIMLWKWENKGKTLGVYSR
jgi:hypothetical protein